MTVDDVDALRYGDRLWYEVPVEELVVVYEIYKPPIKSLDSWWQVRVVSSSHPDRIRPGAVYPMSSIQLRALTRVDG